MHSNAPFLPITSNVIRLQDVCTLIEEKFTIVRFEGREYV
jgi:hypothetical protein